MDKSCRSKGEVKKNTVRQDKNRIKQNGCRNIHNIQGRIFVFIKRYFLQLEVKTEN